MTKSQNILGFVGLSAALAFAGCAKNEESKSGEATGATEQAQTQDLSCTSTYTTYCPRFAMDSTGKAVNKVRFSQRIPPNTLKLVAVDRANRANRMAILNVAAYRSDVIFSSIAYRGSNSALTTLDMLGRTFSSKDAQGNQGLNNTSVEFVGVRIINGQSPYISLKQTLETVCTTYDKSNNCTASTTQVKGENVAKSVVLTAESTNSQYVELQQNMKSFRLRSVAAAYADYDVPASSSPNGSDYGQNPRFSDMCNPLLKPASSASDPNLKFLPGQKCSSLGCGPDAAISAIAGFEEDGGGGYIIYTTCDWVG